MYLIHRLSIDWNKVKTLDDVIIILKNSKLDYEDLDTSEEFDKLCVVINKETGETWERDEFNEMITGKKKKLNHF